MAMMSTFGKGETITINGDDWLITDIWYDKDKQEFQYDMLNVKTKEAGRMLVPAKEGDEKSN